MKIINTGTIDPFDSLWGRAEMTHAGQDWIKPYLPLAKVNQRRREMYTSPKIIFAKMAKQSEAFIDAKGEFASINTNCFYEPKSSVSLSYIGGVCNSSAFNFFYDLYFGALRMAGGFYQFQAPQLRVVPIPNANDKEQAEVSKLVEQIAEAIKNSGLQKGLGRAEPLAHLKRRLNETVCKLYRLSSSQTAAVARFAADQGER